MVRICLRQWKARGLEETRDTSDEVSSTSKPEFFLPESVIAFQSGTDVGPLNMTGSTYGSFSDQGVDAPALSNCVFGVVSIPKLQWKQRSLFGSDSAPEACSAIKRTKVMMVGSTETGGLLGELSTSGGMLSNMA
jgi:hypothetical protein